MVSPYRHRTVTKTASVHGTDFYIQLPSSSELQAYSSDPFLIKLTHISGHYITNAHIYIHIYLKSHKTGMFHICKQDTYI